MSEQTQTEHRPATGEPLEPAAQPVAGGSDDGEAAQGDGLPDSY